jgi:hypothetical protein
MGHFIGLCFLSFHSVDGDFLQIHNVTIGSLDALLNSTTCLSCLEGHDSSKKGGNMGAGSGEPHGTVIEHAIVD